MDVFFLFETVDFHCHVSLLHRHGRCFCECSYALPESWTKTKPSNIVDQVSYSWHQEEKQVATIQFILSWNISWKPASQSATYPQPQNLILYTRGWVFPLLFYAQTYRIPKHSAAFASFGKGWEESILFGTTHCQPGPEGFIKYSY